MNDSDIETIFQRLSLSLRVITSTHVAMVGGSAMIAERGGLAVGFTENHYVVMFTLDISGSMAGSRWNSVTKAVNTFISNLSGDDLVASVVFNDTARCLTGET